MPARKRPLQLLLNAPTPLRCWFAHIVFSAARPQGYLSPNIFQLQTEMDEAAAG